MSQDFTDKRVIVMGLGHFGGGVGVTRFLVRYGARVLVTDLAPADNLKASLDQLADLEVKYRLGEHRKCDLIDADLIVVNSAVNRCDNDWLDAAQAAGIATTSAIRLLVEYLPDRRRTIGVTGTAGKSTVTAMIGHILSRGHGRGRVHVGGNIGGCLLDKLDTIGPDDWVVLELSSFMLQELANDNWSPHIAVITNFSPNHLDRHGTLEAYRAAKQVILDYQLDDDWAVMRPALRQMFSIRTKMIASIEPAENSPCTLRIVGKHNVLNAQLAAGAAAVTGIDIQDSLKCLKDFQGLPHRLQLVAQRAGVRYFNDSKSTTPQAATLAMESFEPGVVHVILGGYDKGSDLRPLARLAAVHCQAVYTVGDTGPVIADYCRWANGSAKIFRCQNVELAVSQIRGCARDGDVVLLSPGCASWDQFDNYEQRGSTFIRAVLRL